jgi:ketosteroid isomerase-like protein
MIKQMATAIIMASSVCFAAVGQNSNTSATRQRTTTVNKNTSSQKTSSPATSADALKSNATGQPKKSTGTNRSVGASGAQDPTSGGVTASFNALLDGIRHANVEDASANYWKSPQLLLFNSNGTVTRGWEQMHSNRESSYPNIKDVKLDVKDVRVKMLGRDGALVTCLWTQSQTVKGVPESASGRMTLVFSRVGNAWKIVHLHTSPDAPDSSRVLSSEEEEKTPTKKPASEQLDKPASKRP